MPKTTKTLPGQKSTTPSGQKTKTPSGQKTATSHRVTARKSMFVAKSKWTRSEKKQLLRALQSCTAEEDIAKLHTKIPSRPQDEIDTEVLRLKNATVLTGPSCQTPIETWLDFSEELVHYEEEDLSKCLGRAMSIVSNYETFEEPGDDQTVPDYKLIYKYLAIVLNGLDPPRLRPLEAVVLLDLMHSLVETLRTMDIETQRQVMRWKFYMLNTKVDINNLKDSADRARKALSNEFPEDFSEASQSVPGNSGSPPNPETPGPSQNINPNPETPGPSQTVNPNPETPGPSQTTPQDNNSQGSGETTENDAHSREVTLEGDGSPEVQSSQTQTNLNTSSKRKRGRPKMKYQPQIPQPPKKSFEKPLLYSLNPFTIPVNVLKLKPKELRRRELKPRVNPFKELQILQ